MVFVQLGHHDLSQDENSIKCLSKKTVARYRIGIQNKVSQPYDY